MITVNRIQELYHLFYRGDVYEKLALAERVWQSFGAELKANDTIAFTLARILEKGTALSVCMGGMRMAGICTSCAARVGGGCCSLFMAGENDVLQLVMNMMAGVTVKTVQDDGHHCCFLGERGCVLILKPMFCLNYNCQEIREQGAGEPIRLLERCSGDLLRGQHDLEQLLLRFFQDRQDVLVEIAQGTAEPNKARI